MNWKRIHIHGKPYPAPDPGTHPPPSARRPPRPVGRLGTRRSQVLAGATPPPATVAVGKPCRPAAATPRRPAAATHSSAAAAATPPSTRWPPPCSWTRSRHRHALPVLATAVTPRGRRFSAGSRLGRGAVGAHLQSEELAAGQVTDSCSCSLARSVLQISVCNVESLLCFPFPVHSEQ